jgi:predicted enzyme related to lactoylglutathione lyase
MIKAIHTLIYSDDPAATRAFLRDVLRWPWIESSEIEPEWLIFKTGPSEMGVHPTRSVYEGQEWSSPRHHLISLICDDLAATMAELTARGAEFATEPQDMGFGWGAMLKLPGADDILVYQSKHAEAYGLEASDE